MKKESVFIGFFPELFLMLLSSLFLSKWTGNPRPNQVGSSSRGARTCSLQLAKGLWSHRRKKSRNCENSRRHSMSQCFAGGRGELQCLSQVLNYSALTVACSLNSMPPFAAAWTNWKQRPLQQPRRNHWRYMDSVETSIRATKQIALKCCFYKRIEYDSSTRNEESQSQLHIRSTNIAILSQTLRWLSTTTWALPCQSRAASPKGFQIREESSST